jgi:hypothetical protein
MVLFAPQLPQAAMRSVGVEEVSPANALSRSPVKVGSAVARALGCSTISFAALFITAPAK